MGLLIEKLAKNVEDKGLKRIWGCWDVLRESCKVLLRVKGWSCHTFYEN